MACESSVDGRVMRRALLAIACAMGSSANACRTDYATGAEETVLVVREQEGRLQILSTFAPGKHVVRGLRRGARDVVAQAVVGPGTGAWRPVRSLTLECGHRRAPQAPRPGRAPGFEPRQWSEGFAVHLEPRAGASQFTLRFEHVGFQGAELRPRQVTLVQGNGQYYLTVHNPPRAGRALAARSFTSLMLEYPQAYRSLEEVAELCSLPGWSLVPHSLFSPTVIAMVMSSRTPPSPSAEPTDAQLRRLIEQLDSDQYAAREAASRSILQGGGRASLFLDRIDPRSLSVEQRLEVAYLARSLATQFPPQPRPVSDSQLAELWRTQPSTWLARLVLSSDNEVRAWAIERLQTSGITARLPTQASRAEREQVFAEVWRQVQRP